MSTPNLTADDITLPIKRTDGDTLEDRLSANAYHNILPARYLKKDADGNLIETQEDLFERVAKNIALAEAVYEADKHDTDITVTPTHLKPDHPRRDELAADVFGPDTPIDDTVTTTLTEHNVNKFAYDTIVPDLPDPIRNHVKHVADEFQTLMERLSFIPNCVPPDSLVAADGGLQPITDVEPGERVYDDEDGNARVESKYSNGEKTVLEIETASGYSVRATPEHYFRVISESGDYEWRQVKELTANDVIALQKNFLDDEGSVADLRPIGITDGGSTTVGQQDSLPGRPRGRLVTPDTMTPELAMWLGLYVGDGTARESGVRVAFDLQDKDLLEEWLELTESIFDFQPTFRTRGDSNCVVGGAYRRDLYDFLEQNNLLKETSTTASIPQPILESGRTCISNFLRGLFEADGTAGMRAIELYSHSEELARQVQKLLLGLGIHSSLREKRDGYRVTIKKNVSGKRFVDRIGFISNRKQAAAQRFKEVSSNATSVKIPNQTKRFHEWFQESNLGLDAYRDLSQFLITPDSDYHQEISKRMFKKYADKYPELWDSPIAEYIERDQFYEPISEISEIGTMAVEDMQVPRRSTYIVEGFVSHNSPTLMNAGDELQQLSACFVMSPNDDLTDIHETAKNAAEVFQCLTEESTVITEDNGIVSVSNVSAGERVLQATEDGFRYQPVQAVHRYEDSPTLTVKLSNGRSIRGTPNHRIKVDGEWTRLDEISPGQAVHYRLGWIRDAEPGLPQLETVASGPQWSDNRCVSNDEIIELYSQGLSDYQIADQLDCGKSTIQQRRADELKLPPNGTGGRKPGSTTFDESTALALHQEGKTDSEIATELDIDPTSITRFRNRNELSPNGTPVKPVDQPQQLTEGLAELVGLWLGDGSWHQDGVRFHVSRESVKDYIYEIARRLFDTTPSSTYKQGCYEISINSHEIKRWWSANFNCKPDGAQSAYVPQIIKNAPANIVESFLRGLFTADGTLLDDTYPKLYSSSERLIDDVATLMLGLGYPIKKSVIRDDEVNPYYGLIPTTGQARSAFLREVGFIDERREIGMESIKAVAPRDSYSIGDEYTVDVESVTESGTAPVYDITLVDKHEYITDGIVSHNSGGGCGYAFWRLRPYGDPVGSTGGIASGPITFMETYDQLCETIAQGGTRRGAQMAIMRVSHPDVVEFIHSKNKDVSLAHSLRLNDPDDYTYTSFNEALEEARDLIDDEGRVPKHLRNAVEGHLSNFNISVGVTDEFMAALQNDEEYTFINPRTGDPHIATEHTKEMYERYDLGEYVTVGEELAIPAAVLWDRIVEGAHENGEPGVIYLDRINDEHSFPVESTPTGDSSEYEILATNPCVAEGTLVNTPEGYRRVEEIDVGDEISTVIGSEPVDEIEVHENYPVYRVEFSDGGALDVTGQHRFHVLREDKQVEKIPLHEVEEGDHVRLHPTDLAEAGTDEQYQRELKRGILLGDGCYTEAAVNRNHVHISTSVEDEEYNERVKQLFGEESFRADDPHSEGKATKMVLSDGGSVVRQLELDPAKAPGKAFDPAVLTTKAEVMGLLDGLLASDGNINLYSNHPQIRWDTSSEQLARAIRKSLLSVGIHGRISVIEARGRGGTINGRKVSGNHPKYTVNVSGASARRYAELSRLDEIHPEKADQLFELRTDWMTTGNTWKAKVESIEKLDEDTTVYDLYCDESDTWITEGYVQQGCGEQPLIEYEACNLGHINLSTVADGDAPDWRVWSDDHREEYASVEAAIEAYLEEAIDFEELDYRIEWATRFLENVVTMSDFPVEQIEETVYRNRKIGLGIMGLAQLFIQLGMEYGSEEANEVSRQVMQRINHGSKWTSHELAGERGAFANWEDSKYAAPVEYREWFEHQTGLDAEEWADGFPIRNHNTTTIAPTGTTGMVGNTTGGCEPIYNVAFYKNVSDDVQGEEMLVEFDDYFLRVLEANDIDVDAVKAEAEEQMANNAFEGVSSLSTVPDAIGELFVVTADLSAKQHAAVQCACQAGVDSAISKTVNAPNESTVGDAKDVFEFIYEHGGKGVTYYRDGTRSKQVLTTRAENMDFAEMAAEEAASVLLERIEEVFGGLEGFLDHAAVRERVEDEVRAVVEAGDGYVGKRERPDVLYGVTQRIDTGYGKLYVNINHDEAGRPFELFANIGDSGGFTASFTESLGKTISTALRSGVDPEEIASELQGIRSPKVAWDKGEQIQSIPDAVGTALRRYLDGELDRAHPQQQTLEETAPEETPDGDEHEDHPETDGGPGVERDDATQSLIDAGESPECPECGAMSLFFAEGCKTCAGCGWSEC